MTKGQATREVARCRSNLQAGGSRDFWRWRLEAAIKDLEEPAAILRKQLARLNDPMERP